MTSQKMNIALEKAALIATGVINKLEPYCERVAVAGSIRREVKVVGDIEIVCIPHLIEPPYVLLPDQTNKVSSLQFIELGFLLGGRVIKGGARYKEIYLEEHQINLDLFIVTPPAQWGVIFAIRTGSADFSCRLVTIKQHGGFLPSYLRTMNGHLCTRDAAQTIIDTPEEEDLFREIGLDWVAPKDR